MRWVSIHWLAGLQARRGSQVGWGGCTVVIFWYDEAIGLKERARRICLTRMVSKVKGFTYSARQGSALSSHIVLSEYPLHPREEWVLVMRSEVDFNPILV